MTELQLSELIEDFERDMRIGCHSRRAETSRSPAGQEIRRRGRDILPELATHLKATCAGSEHQQLRLAWAQLIAYERPRLRDLPGVPSEPGANLNDWYDWICSQENKNTN